MTGRNIIIGGLAGLALAGCGGGPYIKPEGLPPLVNTGPVFSGRPVEIYSSVARGALPCWFGGSGPMRATHIFHADAPTADGGAELVIYERDPTQPSPRGKRVYRVVFAPTPQGGTLVQPENLKLARNVAENMERDILKWARGDESCGIGEAMALPQPPPAPAAGKKRKPSRLTTQQGLR
jgi:hypothetical protein